MTKKKVLIITYYWPPAGGPGVQRWLKFVKYLPEFNIEPIVYIPSNPHYPIKDETLYDDIPNDITVIKQPISEPYKLARLFSKRSNTISKGVIPKTKKQSYLDRLMLFIRGNFFIPDARVRWVKPSVLYLSTYIEDFNIDTVVTTGPPHSMHLIGLQLKKLNNINWIADFRDPWTTIGYHKRLKLLNTSKKKHEHLECLVLNTADQIIVTSNITKREFSALTKKPIEVITNGYDIESVNTFELDNKFTLSHIGSLLSDRNPINLWKILGELINESKDFAEDFRLNLVGEISNNVFESINKYISIKNINELGYVSHKEAIMLQKKSQLLLQIEINSQETKCIIPGKLFEYMVSNRPIIALGPYGSDVEQILKETNTGSYFLYSDYDKLKTQIISHYKKYKIRDLRANGIGLQKYSRRELTKQLVQLLLN